MKHLGISPNLCRCMFGFLLAFAAHCHASRVAAQETIAVPPDSPRWDLQGQAKLAEYQGRKCLSIDGGGAVLKDLLLRDGVVDVDVATPASFRFIGFMFRIADDGADA